MKLRSKNILTQGLEKAFLTTSCSAGATSISVTNNDLFLENARIMIGEMGHERTEIVMVGGPMVLSDSSSASASPSPSASISPSRSPSSSASASLSPSVSPSVSGSASYSPSVSPSKSPSRSPSASPSASTSPSASISSSPSVSPSVSPSISPSVSPSRSPSISPSASPSISPSRSPSVSVSLSTSPSTAIPAGTEVVAGNAVTISATIFSHDEDTPVYVLTYDKLRFYRSVNGSTAVYSQIAEVDMDVDNDTLETVYDDTTGLSSYYYKVAFYSSALNTESDLSDPIPGTGYPRGSAGQLINEFFNEVGDITQQNMTVDEAIGLLNEVNDDIISQSRRPYRFLKTSTTLDTVADVNRVTLPSDLAKFDRVLYSNIDDDTTEGYRRISMEEFEIMNSDDNDDHSDDLVYVSIDESTNELLLYPTPETSQTAKLKIYYWKNFDEIDSLSDTLETPNTRIYKLFLMGRYFRKRGVKEPAFLNISDRYLSDYNTEIVKLQRSNRLDMGTPMSMKPDTRHSRGMRRY